MEVIIMTYTVTEAEVLRNLPPPEVIASPPASLREEAAQRLRR
jgi:hypothetical protein